MLEHGADARAEYNGNTFQDLYFRHNPQLLNDRARAERAQLIEWLESNDIPVDPRAAEFRDGR